MGAVMKLEELGPRICILGPSNSGKSTLADAISRARGVDVVHLDQLHYVPHTDWTPRPADEFVALHDAAIAGSTWVMEGNYLAVFPQRLERATGLILLDVPTSISLKRYFRRCWLERNRLGALEGARDNVSWEMIHDIVVTSRAARQRHQRLFNDVCLPKVRLGSADAIDGFYDLNGLAR